MTTKSLLKSKALFSIRLQADKNIVVSIALNLVSKNKKKNYWFIDWKKGDIFSSKHGLFFSAQTLFKFILFRVLRWQYKIFFLENWQQIVVWLLVHCINIWHVIVLCKSCRAWFIHTQKCYELVYRESEIGSISNESNCLLRFK